MSAQTRPCSASRHAVGPPLLAVAQPKGAFFDYGVDSLGTELDRMRALLECQQILANRFRKNLQRPFRQLSILRLDALWHEPAGTHQPQSSLIGCPLARRLLRLPDDLPALPPPGTRKRAGRIVQQMLAYVHPPFRDNSMH